MQFLIFLLLIPLFWVMIIRPQQQQRKVHQEVVAGLQVGDRVMTVGGLVGTLTDIGPELVRLDSGAGHELTFGRTFVRSLVPAPEADVTDDETADELDANSEDASGADDAGDQSQDRPRAEGLAS